MSSSFDGILSKHPTVIAFGNCHNHKRYRTHSITKNYLHCVHPRRRKKKHQHRLACCLVKEGYHEERRTRSKLGIKKRICFLHPLLGRSGEKKKKYLRRLALPAPYSTSIFCCII
ncbi:hypothetical protein ABW19_dt0201479 [Dactylella cylindrospora]|nr:hypothetical protein ABW19_dt0201479 [Dactylella cylindrospora]